MMEAFSQSYAEARPKFTQAAQQAGLSLQSHVHPLPGRDGEELAMDVALTPEAAHSPRMLVLTSGCHGVEGFCGSGVQVDLLNDAALLQAARQAGVGLMFIHGLNPYGFSWWRRVTHEGVDLNRNFVNFSQALPYNADYDEVAPLVVPAIWPPTAQNQMCVQGYIALRGMKAWQAAVSGGQYHRADGLFYGGQEPTWSHLTLKRVLREQAAHVRQLGWVDVHTGLGPSGHGERIFGGPPEGSNLARCRAWWGNEVTSIWDGSSTSALLTGMLGFGIAEACPQAELTCMALEYGTLPMEQVMQALRAEQWLQLNPQQADAAQHEAIKREFRDAFYVDTPAWKQDILRQGREVMQQALSALAG